MNQLYFNNNLKINTLFKVLKNGKASIMRTRLIKIPLQLFKPKKIHCMLIRKIKNIAVKHKGLLQLLICNWLVRSRSDDVHLQLMLEVGVGDWALRLWHLMLIPSKCQSCLMVQGEFTGTRSRTQMVGEIPQGKEYRIREECGQGKQNNR